MGAPQTTVSKAPVVLLPGQLADLDTVAEGDKGSAVLEGATPVPFGVMLAQGSADRGALQVLSNADRLIGIVILHNSYARPSELDVTGLQPKTVLGILRKGRIGVVVENGCTPASGVHVRAVLNGSPGVYEKQGSFRSSKDSTKTIDISAFARFLTTAGNGEVAELEIDMSNVALAQADS